MTIVKRILIVGLLVVGALLAAIWLDYRAFLERPLGPAAEGRTLDIQRGTSLRALASRMTDQGLLPHPWYFLLLAWQRGDQARIQAGEFALAPDLTPPELLRRIVSGQVIQHPVTLVEGWTFRQALAVIDAHPAFDSELSGRSDAELMAALGRPGEAPEGRFFPDTYVFPRHTPGLSVLRRALERMDQVLAAEWAGRRPDLPLRTPHEALILASIVEKETGRAEERAEVAGVFVRRLRLGMRLQTDPTVIYGMGERYQGRIRRADLREPTPYNTYVIPGLPPTPIALPGRAAIHATLHPADGDALYFVARGDGGHVFSATLDEHNRAVRRHILGQDDDPSR